MPPTLEEQLRQLQSLIDSALPNDANADVAAGYQYALRSKQEFLNNHQHPIYFIGPVGIGKSSLIGVAANLLTDNMPLTDRNSLRQKSVLATGSGRTTVCEVRVFQADSPEINDLVLRIAPLARDEMEQEIRLYAEEVWQRKNSQVNAGPDTGNISQEVHRFIRNMTGYSDRQETYTEGGMSKRRNVRPFEDEAFNFPKKQDKDVFAAHMLKRANLDLRTQSEWRIDNADGSGMARLKSLFERINNGTEATALLPERIDLLLPSSLVGSDIDLDVSLIDTRGLDGGIDSRADLQAVLLDPRALLVICSSFNDAPNDSARGVLQALNQDVRLQPALARCVLVLVDQDNAGAVTDANGDREIGQLLKREECLRALAGLKLEPEFSSAQVLAFDVLHDERLGFVRKLVQQLEELRSREQDALEQLCAEAGQFFHNAFNAARPALEEELQGKIKVLLGEALVQTGDDAPLTDALLGAYEAISASHPASRVYACVRRAGKFKNLDIYAAVRATASRACSAWLQGLVNPVWQKLHEWDEEPHFSLIQDAILRHQRDYKQAFADVVNTYGERIGNELEQLLLVQAKENPDSQATKLWQECVAEWGQGDGFKNKVNAHLQSWARKQTLLAHETTIAFEKIPFLRDVKPPELPPSFTMAVKNLRALKNVDNWNPDGVSLLIGANGAGKTTLLKSLQLLRLAYEGNIHDAVSYVFGGSYNLRSRYAMADERIELVLEIDHVRWTLELIPNEGSAAIGKELFSVNGKMLFSRQGLGQIEFDDKAMAGDEKTGLRTLIDRGVKLPALHKFTQFLQRINYFSDPDLPFLRKNGSYAKDDKALQGNGSNALTMLRSWFQDLSNQHRFDFVLAGLRDAFPHQISKLDFKDAGNTLVARLYHPAQPTIPIPLEDEANGVLQMLILLCAVASAEPKSVIAIDEPENGLHPYAMRSFLRQASHWARKHHIVIVLATHSIVLLDEFTEQADHVWVMKGEHGGPTRLDQLYDPDWLACYRLGDLFSRDELVSNED
jgi:predicted ATPase